MWSFLNTRDAHFTRLIEKTVGALYYPKYIDTALYRRFAHPTRPSYGSVFSLLLRSETVASKFYNALNVAKGPSLGANFTLVCPYTILAHYWELEAVSKFGVQKRLVRVSVGMEDPVFLRRRFEEALAAV